MRQYTISENEAGQRLDKFLQKYMPAAPVSFFYKMLRKKNITLNGKKAEGKEKILAGDQIVLFLSDETIEGFQTGKALSTEYEQAYRTLTGITVVYEDADILVMNKPADVLSQKAKEGDLSLNEWLVGYLLLNGKYQKEQLATFRPSVCNRLDRNTLGLVIGAKSLRGSQYMSELLRTRQVKKFYRLLAKGQITKEETLEGYLVKDEQKNQVHLVRSPQEKASYIQTRYYPVKHFSDRTLVEVELITGKTHQIRIHMACTGHPVLGDYKYGDRKWNDQYKKNYQIGSQMLYACRLEFGELRAPFDALSGKVIEAPQPEIFSKLM